MGDLISRKKLLDSLESQFEKVIHRVTKGSQYHVGFWNGLVEAKKTIDRAPVVEAEPKWIPVTERLPETDGWYQVWTKTPFGGFKSFNKASFHNGEWHGGGGRWNNVTHWMPLPEPPEE